MQQKQRGFTLLEIMVVIVILGILASLVVPNLMGNKDQADHQKAVSDIVALENALDMYKLDNTRYPTTDQGLNALITKPDSDPAPKNYKDGGYIKRLPADPWQNEYQLLSPGEHGSVDVDCRQAWPGGHRGLRPVARSQMRRPHDRIHRPRRGVQLSVQQEPDRRRRRGGDD